RITTCALKIWRRAICGANADSEVVNQHLAMAELNQSIVKTGGHRPGHLACAAGSGAECGLSAGADSPRSFKRVRLRKNARRGVTMRASCSRRCTTGLP